MVRVFAKGPGDRSSVSSPIIPNTQKWYLVLPCLRLSIIRNGSRVSGAIQVKEQWPPLYLDAEAIEKGFFGSPSTTIGQFTYIIIFINTQFRNSLSFSLTPSIPYHSSFLAGLLDHILCPHTADISIVFLGRPTLERVWAEIYQSLWLTSSSLLLQQWLTCLVRFTWMICKIESR